MRLLFWQKTLRDQVLGRVHLFEICFHDRILGDAVQRRRFHFHLRDLVLWVYLALTWSSFQFLLFLNRLFFYALFKLCNFLVFFHCFWWEYFVQLRVLFFMGGLDIFILPMCTESLLFLFFLSWLRLVLTEKRLHLTFYDNLLFYSSPLAEWDSRDVFINFKQGTSFLFVNFFVLQSLELDELQGIRVFDLRLKRVALLSLLVEKTRQLDFIVRDVFGDDKVIADIRTEYLVSAAINDHHWGVVYVLFAKSCVELFFGLSDFQMFLLFDGQRQITLKSLQCMFLHVQFALDYRRLLSFNCSIGI